MRWLGLVSGASSHYMAMHSSAEVEFVPLELRRSFARKMRLADIGLDRTIHLPSGIVIDIFHFPVLHRATTSFHLYVVSPMSTQDFVHPEKTKRSSTTPSRASIY